MTEGKFKVRFKRDGQDYKTATHNGEIWLDETPAIELFNRVRDNGIACWLFKRVDGKNQEVARHLPELPENPEDTEEF